MTRRDDEDDGSTGCSASVNSSSKLMTHSAGRRIPRCNIKNGSGLYAAVVCSSLSRMSKERKRDATRGTENTDGGEVPRATRELTSDSGRVGNEKERKSSGRKKEKKG